MPGGGPQRLGDAVAGGVAPRTCPVLSDGGVPMGTRMSHRTHVQRVRWAAMGFRERMQLHGAVGGRAMSTWSISGGMQWAHDFTGKAVGTREIRMLTHRAGGVAVCTLPLLHHRPALCCKRVWGCCSLSLLPYHTMECNTALVTAHCSLLCIIADQN